MLIMIAYPIIRVVYMSFIQNILTRPDLEISFIVLKNYLHLLSERDFWAMVGRTALWTTFSVVGKTIIGFFIAFLLSMRIGLKRVYMILLMIPWVTPMVVAAVTWRWMYDGEFGMINYLLRQVNILKEPFAWLGHELSAFIGTAIVDMWIGIPFLAMMFLAGIQSIAVELHESASLDGATTIQRLYYVVLPIMRPVILVATTLSGIWTFNSFGVIWPMTKGGPVNATETLIVGAYKYSFGSFNMGEGATIAVIIFIILLTFTIVYRRMLMKQDEM